MFLTLFRPLLFSRIMAPPNKLAKLYKNLSLGLLDCLIFIPSSEIYWKIYSKAKLPFRMIISDNYFMVLFDSAIRFNAI